MSLYRGSTGDNVRQIQGMLRQAGVYNGRLDAWYGPKTEDAMKRWQEFLGAKPDGWFGPDTARRTINFVSAINPDFTTNPTIIPEVPRGSV